MSQDSDGPLPGTPDFSKGAVSRAVLKEVVGSSPVIIPLALGAVGLAALLASTAISPVIIYAFLYGGTGFGVGMFALNFFGRRGVLVARYLQQLNAATRDQSKAMATYLTSEFDELHFARGKEQILLLQKHIATIKKLLEEKFTKGDASYEQFLGPAEQLVAQTLNVLKDAAAQLRANQTFDDDYGRKAPAKGGNGSADRRRQLHEDGTKTFDELVERVETSITGLAELTHDVARIGTDASSHDQIVERVKDIASRAKLYVDEKKI